MKADYNQFDVVLVDFGNEQSGSVQCGVRPAIIIQNNLGNHYGTTTIVMPVTSQIKKSESADAYSYQSGRGKWSNG